MRFSSLTSTIWLWRFYDTVCLASCHFVLISTISLTGAKPHPMPSLWTDTIESHRLEVREAIVDAVASLVREEGLLGVTMSAVAARAGIGRATLYKYFPDLEALLVAWHEQQIESHLGALSAIAEEPGQPTLERLRRVLETYATLARSDHGTDMDGVLHKGRHAAHADARLRALIEDLLAQGTREGVVRSDVPPGELTSFCLGAIGRGRHLPKAGLRRLSGLILDGVRGPKQEPRRQRRVR
jgi:AcrR family transcriptional regulator